MVSLGHGIGLRPPHFARLLEETPRLGFLEAISENYFAKGGRPLSVLEQLRARLPIALHGVSLSIGAVEPLDEEYLAALSALVRRIEPSIVSDHLCWGRHGPRYAHDLWPLPLTHEALAHVAGRVQAVQERLGRRLVLENVSSYVQWRADELSEWDFLAELTRRTGCGLLLDVNNVYVSAVNHGFDPRAYLAALPVEAVAQIHLAGHTDKGGWLLDSHDGRVTDPVWALYRSAVERFGRVPTLIEWDDHIPPLDELLAESRTAARIEAEVLGAREAA